MLFEWTSVVKMYRREQWIVASLQRARRLPSLRLWVTGDSELPEDEMDEAREFHGEQEQTICLK